jgi:hypothetical protein
MVRSERTMRKKRDRVGQPCSRAQQWITDVRSDGEWTYCYAVQICVTAIVLELNRSMHI